VEIYKGTDRTAFVGSRYTAKFARSNPIRFIKYAHSVEKRSGLKGVLNLWNQFSADQHLSLKNFLAHGVIANRREHRLANNGEIVIPTRSLFGGLVNIQPTVPDSGLDERTIHSAFVEQLGPKVTKLGHMLEDTNNMGMFEGRVRFVDGGSRGLESLMQTQPQEILQALGSLSVTAATDA
jgi:hypothetical protein